MNWLESLLYGLISGFTEFLPLSSYAHQQILLHLFGEPFRDPARDLFVHVGLLFALRISCRSTLEYLKRESRARRTKSIGSSQTFCDNKLIKRATLPMLAVFFILSYIFNGTVSLLVIAVFMLINGIIIFIPDWIASGNKDAAAMSPLDSILIGITGALSAIPGFSRLGCSVSLAVARGAGRKNALRWSLLLSIPALWALIAVDFVGLFSNVGFSSWQNIFQYILSGICSFGAGFGSVKLIRFLSERNGYSLFAYYTWGAALLSIFLYLTVV